MFWLLLLRDYLRLRYFYNAVDKFAKSEFKNDVIKKEDFRTFLKENNLQDKRVRTRFNTNLKNIVEKRQITNPDQILKIMMDESFDNITKRALTRLGFTSHYQLTNFIDKLATFPQSMTGREKDLNILANMFNELKSEVNFVEYLNREIKSNPLYQFGKVFDVRSPEKTIIDKTQPFPAPDVNDDIGDIIIEEWGAFVDVSSTWVQAVAYLPTVLLPSGVYGVLQMKTKKSPKIYTWANISAQTFKRLLAAQVPKGAGSKLWESKLLLVASGTSKEARRQDQITTLNKEITGLEKRYNNPKYTRLEKGNVSIKIANKTYNKLRPQQETKALKTQKKGGK